jgi:glycosyltransferase involved in cell wall biosynthesis
MMLTPLAVRDDSKSEGGGENRTVLLVGNFLSASGGSSGICEDLAEHLRGYGWRVITTSSQRGRIARLADMITTAWTRRNEYAVAQVDVYSGAAFFWAEAVCWVLRRAKKPYILTLHGGNLPQFARHWTQRVSWLLESATVVTVPSAYLLASMKSYCQTLVMLPNPIDISHYGFRLRESVKPRLMWLRALHHVYNPSLAVEVLARVRTKFPDSHLTMVGPDKGDGSLQAAVLRAKELAVETAFQVRGGIYKADVPNVLAEGDIFLNTTNVDNTPISVIEAMASGLCIVSTNVGGLPFLLTHEQDALLVPPNDAEAMTKAVERLLIEPYLAQRLSKQARWKAEQFDWTFILPRWEALLVKTMQSHVDR